MRKAAALIFLALFAATGWLYHALVFRWRDCFDAAGRCFDPDTGTVHHAQTGDVLLPLAGVFLGLAVLSIWPILRRR